jgi:hypothetical protein
VRLFLHCWILKDVCVYILLILDLFFCMFAFHGCDCIALLLVSVCVITHKVFHGNGNDQSNTQHIFYTKFVFCRFYFKMYPVIYLFYMYIISDMTSSISCRLFRTLYGFTERKINEWTNEWNITAICVRYFNVAIRLYRIKKKKDFSLYVAVMCTTYIAYLTDCF